MSAVSTASGPVEDAPPTPQDASAVKVYGREARRDAYAALMDAGPPASVSHPARAPR
ncbi:hypothetical protein [Streptomyces misionensis]|uniref:hypothetical protein n=1 Tax=Streptomyces misionensis TaxID=67331 RepID=UPI000B19A1C9|nr:hypothetical protein [Streptomyces misionensis]